jgi:hypothetical protein
MSDAERYLRYAALAYALGLALHTVDHVRRGLDVVTTHVEVAGNLSTVVGITAVVLVLIGNRWGPLVAVLTGFPIAFGVVAVHLLPYWSAFSDSFADGGNGITAMSWSVVMIEIAGALAMAITGLMVLRERRVSAATIRR